MLKDNRRARIKKALPIAMVFLFAFSAVPLVSMVNAASIPTKPGLSQITFVDYQGNDASGVADLTANKIDAYDFALTPSAASSLPSSYVQYVAPASIYGVYLNPQNTT